MSLCGTAFSEKFPSRLRGLQIPEPGQDAGDDAVATFAGKSKGVFNREVDFSGKRFANQRLCPEKPRAHRGFRDVESSASMYSSNRERRSPIPRRNDNLALLQCINKRSAVRTTLIRQWFSRSDSIAILKTRCR